MAPKTDNRRQTAVFREVFVALSDALGPHLLPVDESATEIGRFLAADGIHHELCKQVVQRVYKANRCHHLNSPIDTATTFDALGGLFAELNAAPGTDVDQIDFLEALGVELRDLLPPVGRAGATAKPAPVADEPAPVVHMQRVLRK